jgi:NTP pyrophosphatase (non-canonical NTP hydrolase)
LLPQEFRAMRIDFLAREIEYQADRLFPKRTDTAMFLKIYHETAELIDADTPVKRSDEFADLMILLLDYGSRHGIEIEQAIKTKMAINENRKWKTNEMGVNQHVE